MHPCQLHPFHIRGKPVESVLAQRAHFRGRRGFRPVQLGQQAFGIFLDKAARIFAALPLGNFLDGQAVGVVVLGLFEVLGFAGQVPQGRKVPDLGFG